MQFIFIHNKFKLLTANIVKFTGNTLIFDCLQKVKFKQTYFINEVLTVVGFTKMKKNALILFFAMFVQ